MERVIRAWHQDALGEWVAELDCRHGQHVRHQPPWQERAWVLDAAEREARVGSLIGCPLCDRFQMPEGLLLVRTTPEFTATTVPGALRNDHRVAEGVWGRLRVFQGSVVFRAANYERTVPAGHDQPIAPGVVHSVSPDRDARFAVEFWK